jgi:hypothetical protein
MLRPIVGTPRSRILTLRCPAIGCQHEHASNHALQVSLGLQSRRCIHIQFSSRSCGCDCRFLTTIIHVQSSCLSASATTALYRVLTADLPLCLTMLSNMTTGTQNHFGVEWERYHQRSIQSKAEHYRACYHGAGSSQRTIWPRHAQEPQKFASKASRRPRRRSYKATLPALQRDNQPLDDHAAKCDVRTDTAAASQIATYTGRQHGRGQSSSTRQHAHVYYR